jgi:hypothetical protein
LSAGGPVDLNQILRDPRYAIELKTLELPDERAARLQRAEDDARHRRKVFWAAFAVVVSAAAISLLVLLLNGDADNRAWARTIFAAILTGLVGYVAGSGAKSSL